ncbi:MAG: RNA polymerase sigma factor [Bacteroidia bacterium]
MLYSLKNNIQDIIRACINKESKAEYALYRYCFDLLIPICMRYSIQEEDAVELLNLGFCKILFSIEKYNGPEFNPWAKTIMVNTIIDEFRKRQKEKQLFSEKDIEDLSQQQIPFNLNEAEDKIQKEELIKLINNLPEIQKLVLNLHVFEGLSHKEIAEQLSLNESSSRWHLMNARNELKKKIKFLFGQVKMMLI